MSVPVVSASPRQGEPQPLSPSAADLWARFRGPLLVVAILVVAAVLLAVVGSGSRRGFLDPQGVDRTGSRALARLLAAQGVDIREATTTDAALAAVSPDSTILVTVPDLLSPAQAERILGSGADVVLVAPRGVHVVGAGVSVTGTTSANTRDPRCTDPIAERAGAARMGGVLYASKSRDATGAVHCYPADGGAALMVNQVESHDMTVLGSADILTNQYLDEDGNAALALGLLGQHRHLIWYRPTLEPGQGGTTSIGELLPPWVGPAVAQLLIATGIAALWRARRLGPVVAESLPVVVRAAEVVEGRARLYRRAGARDRAAAALREAASRRLADYLGLPRGTPSRVVASAAAARAGQPASDIGWLLDGPAPEDDKALVRLADSLDTLEQEVRHP